MIEKWDDMDYWSSGEWQVCEERLSDLRRKRVTINPKKENMFAALDACPFEKTKVMIIGQDPYPKHEHATGIAFSIPKEIPRPKWPPTLVNIFKELQSDLLCQEPPHGDLTSWVKQGVLLWNAIPTCTNGQVSSHDWCEYEPLTKEIIERLDNGPSCVTFVFLGHKAREYLKYVKYSSTLETSHPSPLGAKWGFFGSRLFSSINGKLCHDGNKPIDWRIAS